MILSYFCRAFSDMETFYHESNEQGKLHSYSHHRISGWSSTVHRLASRSFTGRGLDVKVHQNYGYMLHLIWEWKSNKKIVNFQKILLKEISTALQMWKNSVAN